MDFLVGLPKTWDQHDSVWVVVDLLIESAHFIPIKITYTLEMLAQFYLKEVVRLHGISN